MKEEVSSLRDYSFFFERYGEKYRWLVLMSVGLGTLATLMASTSVNVAIPTIMGAFGIGQDKAQWLSTGFLAASTVTMLMSSWCIKRFGIRATFFLSMIIFIFSSFLAALSNNIELLIFSRVMQGFASGFLLPLIMILISAVFPSNKQGLGMGVFGILAVMGPAVAPYVGGIVIDSFNWRTVFLIVLPMAIISVPLGLSLLPEHQIPKRKTPKYIKASSDPSSTDEKISNDNFDWLGITLLTISISVTLYALSNGQRQGWLSNSTLINITIGITTGIAFIWRQYHASSPLLDMRLFKSQLFCQGAIISFMYGAFMFSTMYTVPLFLQTIQNITPTNSGFALLPGGIVMMLVFPISGALSDRYPPHHIIAAGLLFFAFSTWIMINANNQTALIDFIFWIIIGRIGMALIMPPLNNVVVSDMPKELVNQAAGAVNFFRQLGGALGVNLISIILERQTYAHIDYITSTQHQGNSATMSFIANLQPELQQIGIESSQQNSVAVWILGKELYKQGLTHGFQDTFMVTTILTILTLIPTYIVYKTINKNKKFTKQAQEHHV